MCSQAPYVNHVAHMNRDGRFLKGKQQEYYQTRLINESKNPSKCQVNPSTCEMSRREELISSTDWALLAMRLRDGRPKMTPMSQALMRNPRRLYAVATDGIRRPSNLATVCQPSHSRQRQKGKCPSLYRPSSEGTIASERQKAIPTTTLWTT